MFLQQRSNRLHSKSYLYANTTKCTGQSNSIGDIILGTTHNSRHLMNVVVMSPMYSPISMNRNIVFSAFYTGTSLRNKCISNFKGMNIFPIFYHFFNFFLHLIGRSTQKYVCSLCNRRFYFNILHQKPCSSNFPKVSHSSEFRILLFLEISKVGRPC